MCFILDIWEEISVEEGKGYYIWFKMFEDKIKMVLNCGVCIGRRNENLKELLISYDRYFRLFVGNYSYIFDYMI